MITRLRTTLAIFTLLLILASFSLGMAVERRLMNSTHICASINTWVEAK